MFISDYEVVRTRGVNVLVRNARLGEKTQVHHDRLYNPLVFRNVDVPSGDEANDPDGVQSVPSEFNPDGNETLNQLTLNTDGNNTINLYKTFADPSSTLHPFQRAPNVSLSVLVAVFVDRLTTCMNLITVLH